MGSISTCGAPTAAPSASSAGTGSLESGTQISGSGRFEAAGAIPTFVFKNSWAGPLRVTGLLGRPHRVNRSTRSGVSASGPTVTVKA